MEQRTDDWYTARLGKFTASEIHKIMGSRGLGETGKTYALEKAIEQVFGEVDEHFLSVDMQRGVELEPLAFANFKEKMSLQFIDVVNCGFFNFEENAGASPDGLVGTDGILEIKCPRNSTFFKLVATGEIDQKYLYQMQMQMLATGRSKAYFLNYIIIDGKEYSHLIEIEKDEEICTKMQERILEATKIKNEHLINLKKWK